MDSGRDKTNILDEHGEDETLATYNEEDGILTIYTIDEDEVGEHRLTLRNCDSSERLIEIDFNI